MPMLHVTHAIVPATAAPEPYTIEYHGLNGPTDIDTFDDLGEALSILAARNKLGQFVVTITCNPNYIDGQADSITYAIA